MNVNGYVVNGDIDFLYSKRRIGSDFADPDKPTVKLLSSRLSAANAATGTTSRVIVTFECLIRPVKVVSREVRTVRSREETIDEDRITQTFPRMARERRSIFATLGVSLLVAVSAWLTALVPSAHALDRFPRMSRTDYGPES